MEEVSVDGKGGLSGCHGAGRSRGAPGLTAEEVDDGARRSEKRPAAPIPAGHTRVESRQAAPGGAVSVLQKGWRGPGSADGYRPAPTAGGPFASLVLAQAIGAG